MTRFNKKALLIDKIDDKVLVTAFTNGLQSEELLFSIYKNDPKTITNMLYRAIDTTFYTPYDSGPYSPMMLKF